MNKKFPMDLADYHTVFPMKFLDCYDGFIEMIDIRGTADKEMLMVGNYVENKSFRDVEKVLGKARVECASGSVEDRIKCIGRNLHGVVDINPKRLREYMTRMENPNPQ